jgi:hypothetical protein
MIENTTPDESIIEKTKPSLKEVKRAFNPNVYKIYTLFANVRSITPLPEKDTIDASTRIAYRITKSAKIIYNKYRTDGEVQFDTLLKREGTEIAARHIVFAAIAYNALLQIDYEAHKLTPNQIKQLWKELHTGEYEVKSKDDRKTIVVNTENETLGVEFILTPHSIEVIGLSVAVDRVKNSEYRDIVLKNFETYRCFIVLVKEETLYDIYVALPVPMKKEDGKYHIHEMAFKIRCNLEVYPYMQNSSGLSDTTYQRGIASSCQKNTIIQMKKKYDWCKNKKFIKSYF